MAKKASKPAGLPASGTAPKGGGKKRSPERKKQIAKARRDSARALGKKQKELKKTHKFSVKQMKWVKLTEKDKKNRRAAKKRMKENPGLLKTFQKAGNKPAARKQAAKSSGKKAGGKKKTGGGKKAAKK